MADQALAAVERWFVRRGLPHFQAGYDARTDIWTRALPALVAWYVLGALFALDLNGSAGKNLALAALTAALLVATWVGSNLLRRRPAFEVPRRVGARELAVVVVGPVIPSLATGQWGDAAEALALGLVVLGVVYVGTSYGVVAMLGWALRETRGLIGTLLALFTRALPLLLVAALLLLFTTEVWQVFGTMGWPTYPLSLGGLFATGAVFVLARLRGDLDDVARFDGWAAVDELVPGTPADALAPVPPGSPPPADLPRLTRRQWANVALVTLFGQGVQITAVGLGVGLAVTAFGVVTVSEATALGWTGSVDVVATFHLGKAELALTEQLLRVAGFIGAFSALTFTVYLATDEAYRAEFRESVVGDIRRAFAVRARYLLALGTVAPRTRRRGWRRSHHPRRDGITEAAG